MSPPPYYNSLIYKAHRFLKVAKMPFLRGKICPLQGLFCPLQGFGLTQKIRAGYTFLFPDIDTILDRSIRYI
jgi:hypothetical protein